MNYSAIFMRSVNDKHTQKRGDEINKKYYLCWGFFRYEKTRVVKFECKWTTTKIF